MQVKPSKRVLEEVRGRGAENDYPVIAKWHQKKLDRVEEITPMISRWRDRKGGGKKRPALFVGGGEKIG